VSDGASDRGDRLEHTLELLRHRGGRVTTARRAVVAALLEADAHVNADDVAARVQATHPDVHLSTVYRTLEALERLGVVDHVHLGHGRAVYHLADDRHHHLMCERCGAVIEVPEEVFDDLSATVRQRYGFTLQPKHFAVLGRCHACAT
jgi:Fe2+ or Zn2+ uptake regulation protein